MVYTPKIDKQSSEMLRRLAWGVGTHMTTTLKQVLQIVPKLVESYDICMKCKDRSICKTCAFNRNQEHDQFRLTLEIKDKKLSVRDFPIIIHEGKKQVPEKEKV